MGTVNAPKLRNLLAELHQNLEPHREFGVRDHATQLPVVDHRYARDIPLQQQCDDYSQVRILGYCEGLVQHDITCSLTVSTLEKSATHDTNRLAGGIANDDLPDFLILHELGQLLYRGGRQCGGDVLRHDVSNLEMLKVVTNGSQNLLTLFDVACLNGFCSLGGLRYRHCSRGTTGEKSRNRPKAKAGQNKCSRH
jgi:hypothetical protein